MWSSETCRVHKVICEPGASLQSTIDFLNNWKEKSLLAKEGQRWHNPHDHGMLANWKVNFLCRQP